LIACAGVHPHAVPGHRLHVTVRLGSTAATLSGRFRRTRHDELTVRHGRVGVATTSLGRQRYVDALCLVRMPPGHPPLAAVAASGSFNQCCNELTLYPVAGHPVVLHEGTVGAAFEPVGDRELIVTADPRFTGELTDYADTEWPIRIDTVARDHIRHVTRRHLDLVRRDARQHWRGFVHPRNGPHGGLGALAAWAADEWTLSRGARVQSTLHRLLRQGRLRGASGFPSGRRYLRALDALLVRTGYTSRR
jgi:hypothetical protein